MVRIKTGLIFLLVVSSVLGVREDVSAQGNRTDPVIVAIDAAIKSLKEQPNQFSLDVTVIGVSGTASGGGTGVSVVANGGGPGSQTTGLSATIDGTQVKIAQRTADTKLQQESQKAVNLLMEIKTALQAPKVDKPTVQSKLTEFLKTYVAPALKSVIEALVMKRLGL
jgi:hypothetical protein